MGRPLTTFERQVREDEKNRARQESATWRAAERQRAMQTRQHERQLLRQEREAERYRQAERKRQEKERVEQERQIQIERLQDYVSTFDAYLTGLSGFHRQPFSISSAKAEYDSRSAPREFTPNKFLGVRLARYQIVPFSRSPYDIQAGYSNYAQRYFAMAFFLPLGAVIPLYWFFQSLLNPLPAIAVIALMYYSMKWYRRGAADFLAREKAAHDVQEAQRQSAFEADQLRIFQASLESNKAFEAAVKRFDAEEVRLKAIFMENDSNRLEVLSSARSGDSGSIGLLLEAMLPLSFDLPPCDLAMATIKDYEIGYRVGEALSVDLLIHLPEMGVVPERSVMMSADRKKLKYKVIPETERRSLYASFIASFCLAHVIETFRALPFLHSVRLEASYQQIDPKSGHTVWPPIILGTFLPEIFRGLKLETVDPVAVLENFNVAFHSPSLPKSKKSTLEALIQQETVVWASEDDAQIYIPYGVLPTQTNFALRNQFSEYN